MRKLYFLKKSLHSTTAVRFHFHNKERSLRRKLCVLTALSHGWSLRVQIKTV